MFSLRFALILTLPLSAFVCMVWANTAAGQSAGHGQGPATGRCVHQAIPAARHRVELRLVDANITGKKEDFKRKEEAQNKIDAFLSDKRLLPRSRPSRKKARSTIPSPNGPST